jgi:hypothetical protein
MTTLLDGTLSAKLVCIDPPSGAVAQLGERMTGSHEVRGSIPLGSTNHFNDLKLMEEIDAAPRLHQYQSKLQKRGGF